MRKDGFAIASEHYYWIPSHAFFRSFELEEYANTKVDFKHPLMDPGCGDGVFAAMLQERGVIDCVDVASDYSIEGLWKANKSARYGAVQADIRVLPLKDRALALYLPMAHFVAYRLQMRSISTGRFWRSLGCWCLEGYSS